MKNDPFPGAPLTMTLLAIAASWIAYKIPPVWMLVWTFTGTAAILWFWWCSRVALLRLQTFNLIRTTTEEVRQMELISRMTDHQLEIVAGMKPIIEFIPGDPGGPEKVIRMPNHETIPLEWAKWFISLGDEDCFYPERRFPEGTLNHRMAKTLTEWCVMKGYAVRAAGNQPARWMDKGGACEALGVEL